MIRRATAADEDALRRLWEASTAEIDFAPFGFEDAATMLRIEAARLLEP